MHIDIISIQPLVALLFGVLILILPRLLNYLIAIYLIFIGLVGLYVSKIFTEVKQRPNVIIRMVYGDATQIQTGQDTSVARQGTSAPAASILRRSNAV